jgi:uncharacterized membrane protein YgcG
MTVLNNSDNNMVNPEIVIIQEHNGVFITSENDSVIHTGLLNKDLVLKSTEQQHGESMAFLNRMYNNFDSFVRSGTLSGSGMSGGAKSGGAYSGGAMSGGASSGSGGRYSFKNTMQNII